MLLLRGSAEGGWHEACTSGQGAACAGSGRDSLPSELERSAVTRSVFVEELQSLSAFLSMRLQQPCSAEASVCEPSSAIVCCPCLACSNGGAPTPHSIRTLINTHNSTT